MCIILFVFISHNYSPAATEGVGIGAELSTHAGKEKLSGEVSERERERERERD